MTAAGSSALRTGARDGQVAPQAGRVLLLLTFANILNFYDRTIPAIVVEPLKAEFGLSDGDVGLLSSAFIVVYAVAGIFIGRIADRASRRTIMGIGLILWSLFTAASGGAWSFAALLIARLGVGIGEASYAPAANSTIADLYPASRRSRAIGIFQLGIPIGLILAFFTTGAIVDAFDSWRAPFLVAAVPGLLVALFLLRMPEPERGAAEGGLATETTSSLSLTETIRTVFAIPTMRWLTLAGIGLHVATYGLSTFLVPLFQRYHGMSLTTAGISAGVVLGLSQMIGLPLGGWLADRAGQRSLDARVRVGALALLLAAPPVAASLLLGPDLVTPFIALMCVANVLIPFFHTAALPAIADVVQPALRATAVALFFAAFYLLGGAFGPILVGALSDALPAGDGSARVAAEADGLRLALLYVAPAALVVAAVGLWLASRRIASDAIVSDRERVEDVPGRTEGQGA